MMKKFTLILFTLMMTLIGYGQHPTFNETFKQKKTQRKYSADQIAALKAYLEVLKKGYGIVKEGLNEVGSSKNQAYLRDQQYFNSLKDVSPVVRNSPRIGEIHNSQQKIRNGFAKLNEDCKTDKNFTPSEVIYIGKVYSNMIRECETSLDELMMVASSSTQMQDAERLQRLDKIMDSMLDKFEFTQHFINGTRGLSKARAKEKAEAETLKKLHSKP